MGYTVELIMQNGVLRTLILRTCSKNVFCELVLGTYVLHYGTTEYEFKESIENLRI